jgi:hypothetical protein
LEFSQGQKITYVYMQMLQTKILKSSNPLMEKYPRSKYILVPRTILSPPISIPGKKEGAGGEGGGAGGCLKKREKGNDFIMHP